MSLRNLDRWVRQMRDDVASLEVPTNIAERFGRYRGDPVGFVCEILAAEPQPYQVEILKACAGNPRVAVRSGHGVGKTTMLAWVLLWWLLTRPFSRVLILAPSFERQVGRYLLPEVRKWARNAPEPLPIDIGSLTVDVKGYAREWFAVGVQASDPGKVEGGHAESLCVLADEAKALDAEVVAALHGTQTDIGGDRLYVMTSTPGGPSGPFYDAFRRGKRVWNTHHVSAVDSALVSRVWVEERAEEWGEGSPLFQARVLGEFPDEAEGTLIRLADLEAAVQRGRQRTELEGEIRFGVDVARFGEDASALAVWHGPDLLEVLIKRKLDTMTVASWVASEINRRKPARVAVDTIGIGAGVFDRLKQLRYEEAAGVNVAKQATDAKHFRNLRAELFWALRTAFEREEITLPDDPGLLAELSSIRFGYSASGQIQIEKKEETKKRVGRSPDRADAVALGFTGIRRHWPKAWWAGMDDGRPEALRGFVPIARLV